MFEDRVDAGRQLATALIEYRGKNPLVLGLPRGGVVVAAEVARALGARLDVFIVRKIGAPDSPEYAIGALGEGNGVWLNDEVIQGLGISRTYLARELCRQRGEIRRRVHLYRGGRSLPSLQGRVVILVDDGVATGFTALAAVRAVRKRQPHALVLAVPVASQQAVDLLRPEVDRLIVLQVPELLFAVGAHYQRFEQVSDAEVVALLPRLRNAA